MNVLTGTLRYKPHIDQKISYLCEGLAYKCLGW